MSQFALLLVPFSCLIFFGSVNEVESHNKYRQSDLALDKFWVTQCVWIQLCTTVAMGTTMTNGWKMFCYGVKGDHHDKFIGIREFLEKLMLIASIIISQQKQGRRKRTYLTLMKLITKELCLPVRASIIPVLLLAIQRSERYRMSQSLLLRLLLLAIRLQRNSNWTEGGIIGRLGDNGKIFLISSLWY